MRRAAEWFAGLVGDDPDAFAQARFVDLDTLRISILSWD